jgi:hypothetical protein
MAYSRDETICRACFVVKEFLPERFFAGDPGDAGGILVTIKRLTPVVTTAGRRQWPLHTVNFSPQS